MRYARRSAGFTVLELTIVLMLILVILLMGLPGTVRTYEHARVRYGVAALDSLWTAQRLHRIHVGRFAPTVQDLVDARLVPPGMAAGGPTWAFDLPITTRDSFVLRASRLPSGGWSGVMRLDELGTLNGGTWHALGDSVQP